jgi:hypothetical protein
MGCGCKARINEKDPRAELWKYIFGSLTFPLLGPFLVPMGDVVGYGFKGDARALTSEQRERLIEKMVEKFHITREEVEEGLKDGVVPIKGEEVIVEICRLHVMDAVIGHGSARSLRYYSGEEDEEENIQDYYDNGGHWQP